MPDDRGRTFLTERRDGDGEKEETAEERARDAPKDDSEKLKPSASRFGKDSIRSRMISAVSADNYYVSRFLRHLATVGRLDTPAREISGWQMAGFRERAIERVVLTRE